MSNIAYVRVSTVEQNEQRQIEGIKSRTEIDKWFKEKVSGKNKQRKELMSMIDYVRSGDKIYIESFSRLSRSTKDLLELIELFKEKNVELISLKENLDTSTPTGRLLVSMIASINEFERENLLERQREGIAIAKREGKYTGRKKIAIDAEQFKELYDQWINKQITQKHMYEELGIKRTTLHNQIKEYQEGVL